MEKLVISEYGRNIQNMILEIKGEKDYIKRQQYAEAIVDLMHQMHPTDKHNPDSKTKLWHHLFKIADWDIHVTPPDGVTPTPDNTTIKPESVVYPEGIRKNRHYGKNVQILIDKAVKMEDSEKKEEFVMIIAAYMKLAYRTWNKEHFVSDDVISKFCVSDALIPTFNVAGKILTDKAIEKRTEYILLKVPTIHGPTNIVGNLPDTPF